MGTRTPGTPADIARLVGDEYQKFAQIAVLMERVRAQQRPTPEDPRPTKPSRTYPTIFMDNPWDIRHACAR